LNRILLEWRQYKLQLLPNPLSTSYLPNQRRPTMNRNLAYTLHDDLGFNSG